MVYFFEIQTKIPHYSYLTIEYAKFGCSEGQQVYSTNG